MRTYFAKLGIHDPGEAGRASMGTIQNCITIPQLYTTPGSAGTALLTVESISRPRTGHLRQRGQLHRGSVVRARGSRAPAIGVKRADQELALEIPHIAAGADGLRTTRKGVHRLVSRV